MTEECEGSRAAVTVARREDDARVEDHGAVRDVDGLEAHAIRLAGVHVDLAGRDNVAVTQLFLRVAGLARHLTRHHCAAHGRRRGDQIQLPTQEIHRSTCNQLLRIVAAAVDLDIDVGAATTIGHDDRHVLVDVRDGKQDGPTRIGESHQADIDVVGVVENRTQRVLHAVQAVLAHPVGGGHAARGVEDEEHVGTYAGADVDIPEIDLGIVCLELNRQPGDSADHDGQEQGIKSTVNHLPSLLRREGAIRITTCLFAFCEVYRTGLAVTV